MQAPVPTAPADGWVLWHTRQLRVADHPAVAYIRRQGGRCWPIFIADPRFCVHGRTSAARLRFLFESLADLQTQYADRGGSLSILTGDPRRILPELAAAGWQIATPAEPTGRYGLARDDAVAAAADVTFVDADGLLRGEAGRDDWRGHVTEWFRAAPHAPPAASMLLEGPTETTPTALIDRHAAAPAQEIARRGGTTAAHEQLQRFIAAIDAYPGSISAPADARTGTSQLSPYLRFGCLSLRAVYQAVMDAVPAGRPRQMFISRLYWNRYYNQRLADWPGWLDTAVNPAMVAFHADTHDPALVTAWRQGRTGFPMVDASMRCLRRTGWLNFRMRAMCASFLCDLCQQPWRPGADWYYRQLLDADPAINYTQFQLQAGMDGRRTLRIYNPRKQVRDNDPDGRFIHRWVPELRALPLRYLERPEHTPLAVQQRVGVRIGTDYPRPVIDHDAARAAILRKFEQVRPAAERARRIPTVARRIDVARGAATGAPPDVPPASTADPQRSLSEF